MGNSWEGWVSVLHGVRKETVIKMANCHTVIIWCNCLQSILASSWEKKQSNTHRRGKVNQHYGIGQGDQGDLISRTAINPTVQ